MENERPTDPAGATCAVIVTRGWNGVEHAVVNALSQPGTTTVVVDVDRNEAAVAAAPSEYGMQGGLL
jgi:hypothetical protein